MGSFLLRTGVKHGDRVLLVSENRPEWAIAYFGILRAGATVVPVDPGLERGRGGQHRPPEPRPGWCCSPRRRRRTCPGLWRTLSEPVAARSRWRPWPRRWRATPRSPYASERCGRAPSPDDVASLIFTSGHHRHAEGRDAHPPQLRLAGPEARRRLRLRRGRRPALGAAAAPHLRVLGGLLMPFSRGAEITYLDELTADRLGDVLETGRVTAMIGVPALWQLLPPEDHPGAGRQAGHRRAGHPGR